MLKKEKKDKINLQEYINHLAVDISAGCNIQEGKDGRGWPCGTCFCAGLAELIDTKSKEYKEHNDKVDRINEVWRFILQLRDQKY